MLSCKELLVVLIVLAATCCGQDTEPMMNDGRMIGGEEVNIKDYNYMASLQEINTMFYPGSTVIIHPNWLLSTTLTITNATGRVFKRHKLHVMAGNSERTLCAQKVHIRNVANYYIQPGHTAKDTYSLALIQLSEPFDFGPVIGSIGIPTKRGMALPKVGDQCIALDQSRLITKNITVLSKIVVTIVRNSECAKMDFSFICTTHKKKKDKINCPNTRAAMVCKGILVGFSVIVNYKMNQGCGNKDSFVNWVRVDSDLPWIRRMIATTSKVTHKDVAPNTSAAPAASSGHDFTAPLILVLAAAVLTVAK